MVELSYLKQNVFPGESGGDYNALFGYANRQGPFQGVRLTDMTINQALQFADPSGPYAAHVRGQIGRTATPMGAYQVVGTTLRDAVRGLGLTGNEPFDQATQDRIGQWIYENQGPGAWEAWGKGGGGDVTVSTSGGRGMGLLDFQNEQPQPFGQRLKESWRSGDLMDRLAVAFNAMRLNPDPTIAQIAGNRMTQRSDQKAQEKTANRTAAWLSSLGRQDLVDAMMSGGLDPKAAAQIALTPAKPPADDRTAMVKNYEYWISQGYEPEKAAEMARAGAGGSTTVVNTGAGDKKFDEGFATADAETLGSVYSAGLAATRNIGRIDQLERFLATAPQGLEGGFKAMASQIGISLGEGTDEVQAAQAIINSLVPEQRPPGSGTMSDADLALFKSSLPSIMNQPGGNAYILQTMRGIAQYDAAGANIVQRLRAGEIDRPTAFQLLMERKNPLSDFKAPAPAQQPPGAKAPPVVIDGVTIERLP